jgi:hypothetical protein
MKGILKIVSTFIVILIVISSFPFVNGEKICEKYDSNVKGNKELHLLRVEHYLELKADNDVDEFYVKYACPPIYRYQVPILVHLFNDTDEKVMNYKIEDDIFEPNKFVNFSVDQMNKDEKILIHFTVWVLVENYGFGDLPDYIKFPKISELPDVTTKWLTPTEVVQSDSFLIKLKAKQLRGFSDNLIKFAGRIAPFIKNHRYPLFVLELYLGLFLSQDALTTLFIGGENVGRGHLACAMLRSQGVPSRVLLVNNDQGFWTQMHYMAEYYCPGYDWVLIETTYGRSPYETKRQIINRICYPDDENDTKDDYILKFMKGEERWIWVENDNVNPYYVDCDEGSKSQMFSENVVLVNDNLVDNIFNLTESTFTNYQQYLGIELIGDNITYFNNAIEYQYDAIESMKDNSPHDFLNFIKLANEEYNKISV